jgi:glycosyltransferase involved in cell wall biosynthesis
MLTLFWRIAVLALGRAELNGRLLWVVTSAVAAAKGQNVAWRTDQPRGGLRPARATRGKTANPAGLAIRPQSTRRGATQPLGTSSFPAVLLSQAVSSLGCDVNGMRPHACAPEAKYDVVVLPIIDWHFRFQRPQQLALGFARAGHRVFYVSSRFCDQQEVLIRKVADGVLEAQLPGPHRLALQLDAMPGYLIESTYRSMEKLRHEFDIREAACLVDLPFWTPLALRLRRQFGWKLVYDCMDYHRGLSYAGSWMLEQEEHLIRESDLVLASGRNLLSSVGSAGANCRLLPNAADFAHFRFPPPFSTQADRPPGRPVIGYFGAISEWFDAELVAEIARARPTWDLLLIGSTYAADLTPLDGLTNVRLQGEMAYEQLPASLHQFDVAIIPFKKTPLTDAVNPVKLFEYLSAGKHVVATDLDELQHYREVVSLASTPGEWVYAIERGLADTSEASRLARIAFARENTWDRRISELKDTFATLYDKIIICLLVADEDQAARLLDAVYSKVTHPNVEVILLTIGMAKPFAQFLSSTLARHSTLRIVPVSLDTSLEIIKQNCVLGSYIILLTSQVTDVDTCLASAIRHSKEPASRSLVMLSNNAGSTGHTIITSDAELPKEVTAWDDSGTYQTGKPAAVGFAASISSLDGTGWPMVSRARSRALTVVS